MTNLAAITISNKLQQQPNWCPMLNANSLLLPTHKCLKWVKSSQYGVQLQPTATKSDRTRLLNQFAVEFVSLPWGKDVHVHGPARMDQTARPGQWAGLGFLSTKIHYLNYFKLRHFNNRNFQRLLASQIFHLLLTYFELILNFRHFCVRRIFFEWTRPALGRVPS